MKSMEEAKRKYDEIPIPSELSKRVGKEIERANMKRKKILVFRRRVQKGTAAAAAVVVLFTAALNTNTAFAETAGQLPVIGPVARVLTFRSYQTEEEDLKISVEIPTIEMISEDMNGLEQSVNEEILALCEQYAQAAKIRAEEYRQAFLDTGGTEEEWAAHIFKNTHTGGFLPLHHQVQHRVAVVLIPVYDMFHISFDCILHLSLFPRNHPSGLRAGT